MQPMIAIFTPLRWSVRALICAVTVCRLNNVRPHDGRSEEHTSELQSLTKLVCRLLLEKKIDGSVVPPLRGCVDRARLGGRRARVPPRKLRAVSLRRLVGARARDPRRDRRLVPTSTPLA